MVSCVYSVLFLFYLKFIAADYPTPKEGDFVINNFCFKEGRCIPELRLHYATIGTPVRDDNGRVTNAVLIMHGTTGSWRQFTSPQFADVLFGPGQLLDATRYFIIRPDAIGHGGSSKPSNGLAGRFPYYTYDDMVLAQYSVVTAGLGVNHLRLIMGTSMGCMHSWVWGETYPDFMDALMPLACLPVEIAGRNRVWRKALMDSVQLDPAWRNGEYVEQPLLGLRSALYLYMIAGSCPLQWQKDYPTRELADQYLERNIQTNIHNYDANDMIYAFNSSRFYNPSPNLEKIKVPVMFVNSADDFINPPELGIAEREIIRVSRGKFVLLPISNQTRGHGTYAIASVWKQYLQELLEESI